MSDLLETLQDPTILKALETAPETHAIAFAKRAKWLVEAHNHQVLPHGDWWSIWLLLAGRGAGKTRTAAEQIWWWAWENPGTRWLVSAPTSSDVRSTCFEGDSGLMAVIPPVLIEDYNKALHELKLVNGSLIKGIPASEPERFRGPQFHGGWCCTPGTLIMLANGFEIPIEDVREGDLVMTRHGVRRVLCSTVSGNPNDLVTIGCGDTSLTVTIDHPILVGDQWIPAGDIRPGDFVWGTSTSAAGTHTGSSTSSTLGQSPRDGSFITRMKTRATTTPTTLRQCLARSISGFTQLAAQTLTLKKQPQAELLSFCVPQSQPSAFNVKPTLSQRLLARLASSVLGRALSHGAATSSSQSCANASSAKANTLPRSDSRGIAASNATPSPQCAPIELKRLEVLRVERLPNSKTYNLTVEGEHEFIANGIVVHNCDELAAWEYLQEAWDQIMFGMRLKVHQDWKTRLICTTTPRPKDLIVELVGRDGDDVNVTTASTYANIDNLSENFRKQILQYEGTKLGRQEIYAEILDPEEGGIVKRDWFRLWPAERELPKLEFILQSYDCAFTEKHQNDPTAQITFGVFKPQDGPMAVLIIDAWQDRLQYPDLKPKVLEEYETVYGEGKDARRVDLVLVEDKAAGIPLIQDLQRAHVFVRAYNPGRADKVQRLSIIANIIKAGRVWVPESSNRKGYVRDWAEGMISQICSFPETTHDDFCVDSESLVTMADGSCKRIREVLVGEMVQTPAGPRRVTAVHDNGIKEVWQLHAAGRKLLATANHEVFTQKGWVRVDSLTQAVHNVCVINKGDAWHSRANLASKWRRLSSMAADTTATLRAAILRIVGTSPVLDTGCTGMSGSSTTVQSQRECTSTTLTGTRPTTTSATWSACQIGSIASITDHQTEPTSKFSTLNPSGARPQSGTDPKKEGHGTESTPSSLWQRLGASLASFRRSLCNAFGAAQKCKPSPSESGSAAQPARQQSQSFASVKAVQNTLTMRHVFDLTVEGEHCYYANGILVHNCDAMSQALRYLRDAGWLNIDPPPPEDYDAEDVIDAGWEHRRKENPYAV